MKIPPFWIKEKVRRQDGSVWKLRGISFESMSDARERLDERRRLREAFAGAPAASEQDVEEYRAKLRALDELHEGEYAVLTLEPVLEQLDENNIVTRNRYGVKVLNSTSVCFVDVDEYPLSLGDSLRALFGRKTSPEEKLIEKLRSLCAADESLGVRLYRTHQGWRVMMSGRGIAPDSERMNELFAALHADSLYASLCKRQKCWRARLTPKPYRVGVTGYPAPMDSESASAPKILEWLQRYESACAGKAVCRLVESMGRKITGNVVELHDAETAAGVQDAPLA